MEPNRRQSLIALAAGGAAVASRAPATTGAAAETGLDAFIRMRGAVDHTVVVGCLSGAYDGVVDDALSPLFGVVSATFTQYRPHADGWSFVAIEQAYFTDLATGAPLERWRNPYTGATVAVPVTYLRTPPTLIARDLRFRSLGTRASTSGFQQYALARRSYDGEIVFEERIAAEIPSASGRSFRFNDTTVLRAAAPIASRFRTGGVACQTAYQAVVSWRPWMGMGASPGHMLGFGYGAYGVAISALAPAWVEATRRLHPEILINPALILAALWG